MKQLFYGQIDLTKLGQVARQHQELVKEVQFKDGMHKLINVVVLDKEQTDSYGNSACIKVSCRQEEARQGVPYFLGDLKSSQPQQQQQRPAQQRPPQNNSQTSAIDDEEDDGLPF